MKPRTEIQRGTLAWMFLKTLDVLGPLHGYGIARRIKQIRCDQSALSRRTVYPLLLRLARENAIASDWGSSENNRRPRFHRFTGAGRNRLQAELEGWRQAREIIARLPAINAETRSCSC